MKVIHYAGGEILTGDDLADSVLHYAQSLARKDASDSIDVPARLEDGSIVQVSLLIGPASQLVAIPKPGAGSELTEPALVSEFNRRSALLGNPQPVVADDDQLAQTFNPDLVERE